MIDPAHHPGVFQALLRFRAFYAELAAAIAAVRDGTWLDAGLAQEGGDAVLAGAHRLAQRLQELDWPGRAYWDGLLLEERLYGTRIAGERLFDLAERLIAANAAGQDDLVVALMQAFALGFRGRYR